MEVRYMLDDNKECILTKVDFLNVYVSGNTVFIRCDDTAPQKETMLSLVHMKYLRIYKE